MKAKDIQAMGKEELQKQLADKQKALFDLRFKAVTKQLKNHREIPATKKDVARLKTVSRQRELGTEKS